MTFSSGCPDAYLQQRHAAISVLYINLLPDVKIKIRLVCALYFPPAVTPQISLILIQTTRQYIYTPLPNPPIEQILKIRVFRVFRANP